MGDLVEFLRQKTIGEVVDQFKFGKMIEANTSTNAFDGFNLLISNNILSIPLFDDAQGTFTCFLDLMDILWFLTKDSIEDLNNEEKLKQITCGQIADYSKLDPFIKITSDTNLIRVLQIVSQDCRSLHRMPVVNPEGKLIGIVSQSLLVRFLEPHTKKFDFGTLSIGTLGLGLDKTVVTVKEEESVQVAVQKLKQHKVSGIGIVDQEGRLKGTFSPSALKYFGIGNKVLSIGGSTMREFVASVQLPKEYPLSLLKTATACQVIAKFSQSGTHRIFVVDPENRPEGIISLVDVIDLFFRHILIE